MRRFCLVIVLLAFTSIGCPPAPPPLNPPKKDVVHGEIPSTSVEDIAQLQPRLEGALDKIAGNELTSKYGFWTVLHGILGLGPDKAMITDLKTNKKVKAIDYICDGGELPGLKFEPTKFGLDVYTTRMGDDAQFLAQGHQDQFIAEMAEWGMLASRTFRVGKDVYTFNHFINESMMRASVTQKQELSWTILVIGQFRGTECKPWTNGQGEDLNFEKLVKYECDASIDEAACGGTHRLFGLTWTYHLHMKNGGKKEGVWRDVADKIERYKAIAKERQNRDGTFSTNYFKGPGAERDLTKRIGATGHILEWLALAMTDEELREPWMQNAVNSLVVLILELNDREAESGSLYHAAHGLHLYHERVFGTPAPYVPLLK